MPSGPGIPEGDPGLLRVEAELRRVTELLREELSRAEKPTPEDFGIPEDVPSKGELCCVEKLVRVCNEDYKKELLRIKAEFHGRELEAEAALRKAKEDYETRELNILAAGESKRKERPATTLAKKRGGGGGGGGSVVVEVAAPVQAPAPAPAPKPGSAQDNAPQQTVQANQHGYFGPAFHGHCSGQTADSNKTLLYHQTSRDSTRAIIKSGNMRVGSVGTAGGGIYFAHNEQDTRKALHRGFVFMCHVKLGVTWDIGKRRNCGDFRPEFGKLDYKTLQTRDHPADSVALETDSGPELVVYHSDQVELVMVRACDSANAFSYTSEWYDVEELRSNPPKLDQFLEGKLPSDQHRVKALERKIAQLEAQKDNYAAAVAVAALRKDVAQAPAATLHAPVTPKPHPKKGKSSGAKERKCPAWCCGSLPNANRQAGKKTQ